MSWPSPQVPTTPSSSKSDASAWASGDNSFGQLGLGDGAPTQATSLMPVQVDDGASGLTDFTGVIQMATGLSHSLFLTRDGTVWATGSNTSGQLGSAGSDQASPVAVMTEVAAIAVGHDHSLFLKRDGSVWASGRNQYGQLGLGDNSIDSLAIPQQVMSEVIAIAANQYFSLFLKTDGTCLGRR